MSLEKLGIPVPRLRSPAGGAALFTTLAVVILLSAHILIEQLYVLSWMKAHDVGYEGGFEMNYNGETLKTSWLPTLLYRGPHHQLAIAASAVNIVISILIAGLFTTSVFVKRNIGQHWFLLLLFIPTLTLLTTALLYNFIEHGVTGRLDTYLLHEYASPTGYSPYGAAWLDFESWSCGLANGVTMFHARGTWKINCHRSQLGRWLLLPTWFALCGAVVVSWISFRGVPGWRANKNDDEGRVRLN
ncbi:hypothetical protein M426DRAFT_325227 [Hypoxylon sp. CI-4A]|nr:hypothetical protein M426DRAFT_325227 [Hypoxylon sp. CI-4A]